ncbi:hypothetical protein ATCCB_0035 [Lactobacillus phage ATCCB]|nr:hypothetical protein ATCCB_0035 [Lactobacillus phage ATCCB]
MKNGLNLNGYTLTNEDGMVYLHITKELNDTLLANKELGDLMVELIKQKNVKKVIID